MSAMKLLEHGLNLRRAHGEEFRLIPSLFKISKTYQGFLMMLDSGLTLRRIALRAER